MKCTVWDTNGSTVLGMFWVWKCLFNASCLPGRCLAPGPSLALRFRLWQLGIKPLSFIGRSLKEVRSPNLHHTWPQAHPVLKQNGVPHLMGSGAVSS